MTHLTATLIQAYERVQVELHGKYSVERVADLHVYQNKFSIRQCFVYLLAAPLPCLAMIVLTDLVPLNSPRDGYTNNIVLWGRVFFVAVAITATLLEQGRQFVPGLPCSNREIAVMSLVVAICSTAYGNLLAHLVGFPVPFTVISCSPVFLSSLALQGAIKWYKLVRASKPIQQALVAYVKIMVVQFALTFVYPAFNYLFIQQSGLQQTAVAMLLPVIKLLAKNAISVAVHPKLEDFKPEVVILNVEVFHALFVSYCMQSSTSWTTTIVLMCTDFIHAWFGLHDITVLLAKTEQLETKLRAAALELRSTSSMSVIPHPLSLIEKALFFVCSDQGVRSHKSIRHRPVEAQLIAARWAGVVPAVTKIPTQNSLSAAPAKESIALKGTRVLPVDERQHSLEVLTTDERAEYVAATLQVLHIAEFMLLIEFVEVVIPVIYSAYMTVMFFLPNRAYYPQLARMDSHSHLSTIGSVLGYASLEMLSFVLLCIALRRKLELSPVHQLAFVIHTQWYLVQSKMILWVVFAVHTSLEHFGYDYSFHFAWLRKP